MESYVGLFQECLWISAKALLPLLASAFLVGIFMSFLGSFFQIQDNSFIQIPKILAFSLLLVVLLPWEMDLLLEYFKKMFSSFYL